MAPVAFGATVFDADLILFDKDGTLTEFDPIWRAIYLAAVDAVVREFDNPATLRSELNATLGYDPTSQSFSTHGPFATAANAKVATVVAAVIHRHARPTPAWDVAEELVNRTFLAEMNHPPDPALITSPADLPRLFTSLREAGIRIAVVTSDERDQTLFTLKKLGVGDLVDFVVASDDAYPKKPAPQAVWATCSLLGVDVKRAVVVGDALTDMRMGRAAGVGLNVAVLTGPGTQEQLAPLADVILESIGQIWLEE